MSSASLSRSYIDPSRYSDFQNSNEKTIRRFVVDHNGRRLNSSASPTKSFSHVKSKVRGNLQTQDARRQSHNQSPNASFSASLRSSDKKERVFSAGGSPNKPRSAVTVKPKKAVNVVWQPRLSEACASAPKKNVETEESIKRLIMQRQNDIERMRIEINKLQDSLAGQKTKKATVKVEKTPVKTTPVKPVPIKEVKERAEPKPSDNLTQAIAEFRGAHLMVNSFTELKSLNNPPRDVYNVMKTFASIVAEEELDDYQSIRNIFRKPHACMAWALQFCTNRIDHELSEFLYKQLDHTGPSIKKKSLPAFQIWNWLKALEGVCVASGYLKERSHWAKDEVDHHRTSSPHQRIT